MTAFEIAGRIAPDGYRLTVLPIAGGPVRSSSGITIDTGSVADAGPVDTVVVVGGEGSRVAMQCETSTGWLRHIADKARRMCSVCSGAYLLAAAGLLDERRATTHQRRAEQLQRQFPAVRVQFDRIHVRDGDVWTSAGISAGIDRTLALIADDLRETVARRVAQEMVVYYRHPGGQSQFSALDELGGDVPAFSPLFDWMRADLSQRLTIGELSARMAMSPRNFSRAFTSEVVGSAKAVERLRLEAGRERVENSREPIEQIAATTGIRDSERMRRVFVRAFGQPPQTLRRLRRSPSGTST